VTDTTGDLFHADLLGLAAFWPREIWENRENDLEILPFVPISPVAMAIAGAGRPAGKPRYTPDG
jgi:hypothetical protein